MDYNIYTYQVVEGGNISQWSDLKPMLTIYEEPSHYASKEQTSERTENTPWPRRGEGEESGRDLCLG